MTPSRARAGLAASVMAWLAASRFLLATVVDLMPAMDGRSTEPDDALAALASVVGLALLTWLGLATAVTLVTVLRSSLGERDTTHPFGTALVPPAVRHALVVLLTAALLSGVAPAHASTGHSRFRGPGPGVPGTPGVCVTSVTDRGTGLAPRHDDTRRALDPAWPTGPPARAEAGDLLDPAWRPQGHTRPVVLSDDTVVVRSGDTLWDIAARQLGSAATDTEIAHSWPLWFSANRSVIGADPDRLRPGQRLRPPDLASEGPR